MGSLLRETLGCLLPAGLGNQWQPEEIIDPQPNMEGPKGPSGESSFERQGGNRGGCLVTPLSPLFSSLDLSHVKMEIWGSNLRKMVEEVN